MRQVCEKPIEYCTDYEVLATILRSPKKARILIEQFGSIGRLSMLIGDESLNKILTPYQKAALKAALNLHERLCLEKLHQKRCNHPSDVAKEFSFLKTYKVETFWLCALNTKNYVIGTRLLTKGVVNMSLIRPREVYRPAISMNAVSIIVIHNHPSGDSTPSQEDIDITTSLCRAGDIVGIKVIDHLIIGFEHYSFRENNVCFNT